MSGLDLDGLKALNDTEGRVYIQEVPLGQPYVGQPCPLIVAPWWVGGFLDELFLFRLMMNLSSPSVDDQILLSKDSDHDSLKSSGVVTLEPYVPKPLPQRNNRRLKRNDLCKNKESEILPGVFEDYSYDRYLTIELPKDQDKDIFAVYKDIVQCCGRKPVIYPQGNGRLMIETASPDESARLLSITSLGGSEAKCTPDISLNQSKGLIYAPQLMPYSEEKLETEFSSQGVVNVKRLNKRVSGVLTPQPSLVLTFESSKLPEKIEAAWFSFKVKEYIPRPRRCFHCQSFGHVMNSCRTKAQGLPAKCINCGKDIHGECNDVPSCIHCGGSHSAMSRDCEIFIFEKEVLATRVREKVTFQEAKHRTLKKFIRTGESFSSVVQRAKKVSRPVNQTPYKSTNNNQNVVKKVIVSKSYSKRTHSDDEEDQSPASKSNRFEILEDEMDSEILEFHDCSDIPASSTSDRGSMCPVVNPTSASLIVQAEVHPPPRSLEQEVGSALADMGKSAEAVSSDGLVKSSEVQSSGGLRELPGVVSSGSSGGTPELVSQGSSGESVGKVSSAGSLELPVDANARSLRKDASGKGNCKDPGIKTRTNSPSVQPSNKKEDKKGTAGPSVKGRSKLNR